MENKKSQGIKLLFSGFLPFLFAYVLMYVWISHPADISAGNDNNTEALILDSAESFFLSLKERNFKSAWKLLSQKSHETIINNVYKASKKKANEIKKEDIIEDFNNFGVMFHGYWNALRNNFDPDIVLEERVWEFGTINHDKAIILLKGKTVTELKMYNENNEWKVGFVETFWKRKLYKLLQYLF